MANPENIVKHRFKKGQSGNPNGRPKLPPLADALAGAMGEKVDKILQAIVKKAEQGDMKAAEFLFNRGYGTVQQNVALTGDAAKPIVHVVTVNEGDLQSDEIE